MQLGRNDQYDVFAIEPKRLQQCSVERFDRSREPFRREPSPRAPRRATTGRERFAGPLAELHDFQWIAERMQRSALSSRDDSDELISRRGNGHDVPIAEHLEELLQVRQRGRALGWAGCLQPFGSHRLFEGGLPMPQLCGRFAREPRHAADRRRRFAGGRNPLRSRHRSAEAQAE